ncbi:hypothetical protein [Enterocloster citroniae]|nr:hypothetical protein [Enterocloster citroniae]
MMGTLVGGCHGTVRGSQMAVTIEGEDEDLAAMELEAFFRRFL